MKLLERIMLVDDDVDTNFYNKLILQKAKASNNIIVFQSGKDALTYLEKGNNIVDLILLDINMPVMNGWQFLEHYENLAENLKAAIIVVMLTSSINYDDKKKAERLTSIKKFINKPLTTNVIEEIMALFE